MSSVAERPPTAERILAYLSKGAEISGETLAERLGLSRTSVWKHVRRLRSQGVPIESRPRGGYRFTPDFDPSLFQALRRWPGLGHYIGSTPSTQDLAKAGASTGSADGSIWIAERQVAARGRLHRPWSAPAGGLWYSHLLRPKLPPMRLPPLALIAALTWSLVIEEQTGVAVRLKWPNDLVIHTSDGWRKVGGILTEMEGEMERTAWLIFGVGINVNNAIPRSLRLVATSLSALSKSDQPINRLRLLTEFLRRFKAFYAVFVDDGFEALRPLYWERYSRPNEAIVLNTATGEKRGKARGVDANGGLLIEFGNRISTFSEGEIVQ